MAYLTDQESLPRRLAEGAAERAAALVPGLTLCLAVALGAVALESGERRLLGRVYLEGLVLAILVGAAIRSVWTPGLRWRRGVDFGAKMLLEFAVVLLGASVSAATLLSIGGGLLAGVAGIVASAIGFSFLLGRAFGLPARMALLVACGNSICGNSAIAAVAPVIGAKGEDVAASVAFTALLGVLVVLGLPLAGHLLGLSPLRFGVLSGLTVYAVPQVLAAASPMGPAAVQAGTLIKLARVLMLGPVCFVLSLLMRRRSPTGDGAAAPTLSGLGTFVPWFIVGFLVLAAMRSLGSLPAPLLTPLAQGASALTVLSMAALGLSTDLRSVAKAGPRLAIVVTLSLLALGCASLALIWVTKPL